MVLFANQNALSDMLLVLLRHGCDSGVCGLASSKPMPIESGMTRHSLTCRHTRTFACTTAQTSGAQHQGLQSCTTLFVANQLLADVQSCATTLTTSTCSSMGVSLAYPCLEAQMLMSPLPTSSITSCTSGHRKQQQHSLQTAQVSHQAATAPAHRCKAASWDFRKLCCLSSRTLTAQLVVLLALGALQQQQQIVLTHLDHSKGPVYRTGALHLPQAPLQQPQAPLQWPRGVFLYTHHL